MPAMTEDEVAYGFIKVANEAMCRPIRYNYIIKVNIPKQGIGLSRKQRAMKQQHTFWHVLEELVVNMLVL